MNRRTALRLLTGAVCSTGMTGCLAGGTWDFSKVVGGTGWKTRKQLAVGGRVNEIGQSILELNLFNGLDTVAIITIGLPDLILFHKGTAEVYVSEGLVKRCQTEAELAAVLCSEFGQMVAEKQAERAVGKARDPIPETKTPEVDLGMTGPRAAEVGRVERASRDTASRVPVDAAQLARRFLEGAGYDPAVLDRVEPLLKQSDRGRALEKQMAGSAPAPKWEE